MLFKVKRGTHYKGGVVYKKGDLVDTSIDLVARFGKAKFERDFKAEGATGGPISGTKPAIPTSTNESRTVKAVTKPLPPSPYGKDVTSNFPTAKDVDVTIFERAKWHTVVDNTDGEVLNEKKLREKDVGAFLEQYLSNEDIEEEEDIDEEEDVYEE